MNLEVRNGCFSYGDNEVLRDVNMKIEDHDILAILGRNGAGKTTLLKCIMGMLEWKSGSAVLDGRDVKELGYREFWKTVSYVPQAKKGSELLVRDMIVMGRSSHIGVFGKPSGEDYAMADDVIDRLFIRKLADKPCNELSGGELQLVLIARALVSRPKLIIMDEPESNLDYHNQLHVLKLIKEISKDTACILNTHYPEHALQYANKALIMFPDKTSAFGSTEEIITKENLEHAFNITVHIGTETIEDRDYRYIIPLHGHHSHEHHTHH